MREFSDLGQMAEHLLVAQVSTLIALEHGLEKVAVHIEKKAKAKVGEYQPANGMHDAWPELAESTKEDRVRQGYTPNDPGLRNGDMRDSITHETKHLEAVVGSDSDKLVWFELGTSKQPPRPVLGAAAYESQEKITEILGGAVVTGIVGGRSLSHVLSRSPASKE